MQVDHRLLNTGFVIGATMMSLPLLGSAARIFTAGVQLHEFRLLGMDNPIMTAHVLSHGLNDAVRGVVSAAPGAVITVLATNFLRKAPPATPPPLPPVA